MLVDAARACATRPPDLTAFPADFVVLSYYKIFGYPTGVGALVARREAVGKLNRRYFGGGTLEVRQGCSGLRCGSWVVQAGACCAKYLCAAA